MERLEGMDALRESECMCGAAGEDDEDAASLLLARLCPPCDIFGRVGTICVTVCLMVT